MENVPKPTALFFAPHPDDDILTCGGTMALKVKQGYDVRVVYMTDGRNSHLYELGIASNPSPPEVAKIRKEEAIRAASVLGIGESALVFLNFEDGTLEDCLPKAQRKVEDLLKNLCPREVYFPSRWDEHHDHHATNMVVGESLRAICFQGSAYQYTIWGAKDEAASSGRRKIVDISDFLSLKKKALRRHRSQLTKSFPSQQHPVLSRQFLARFLDRIETFVVWNPNSPPEYSVHGCHANPKPQ